MADIKTPVGDAPILPVILLAVGGYFAWFGVHYFRSDVKWPSDPIKAMLTGKSLPQNVSSTGSATVVAALYTDQSAIVNPVPQTGGATPQGVLNHQQLMNLWTSNGGSPATADIAAAIAEAESSGRPGVTSSNPDGGTNVGLWQLDTKGVGAGHTIAQLKDPTTNARITVLGSVNGTNWKYWSTYVSGAYQKFLTGSGKVQQT